MKKQLAKIALLSAVFCSVSAATAFAGVWNVDHVGRWYQNDDGTYPKTGSTAMETERRSAFILTKTAMF